MTPGKWVPCANALATNFLDRIVKDSVSIHDWCNPTLEDLKRRELPPLVSSTDAENGELSPWKKTLARSKHSVDKAQPKEEEEEEAEEEYEQRDVNNVTFSIFQHQQTRKPAVLIAMLKECAKEKNLHRGSQIHADLMGTELLQKNVFVGSTLVSMYAKCGALAKAQEVLNQLQVRNLVSWNALIAGYAQHGHGKEAFFCFERMKAEGFSPDSVTFLCILKACIAMKAVDRGQEIHAEIAAKGLLEKHFVLSNALIDMYGKFGLLRKAQEVFDKLPMQDVVSWNALILAYAEHGHCGEAFNFFQLMRRTGYAPDAVTFLSIVKACVNMGNLEKGEEIHALIARDGLFQEDIVVGTALVDMYAKCGSLMKAQELFDNLPERNFISWTALITGYAQNGYGQEAIDCFRNMQLGGYFPNEVTFLCVLKACSSIGAFDEGLELHSQIVKEGLFEGHLPLGTALVDMYANCGMLIDAQSVFDNFGNKDIAAWNSLITGYAQHVDFSKEGFKCFEQMQSQGFAPNAVTYVCILKASASLGAAYKGQQIHAEIAKRHLVIDTIIGTALVDMYANCGMLADAQVVFDKVPDRDIAMWNVLIAGYAQLGKEDEVFDLFKEMLEVGIEPDEVTLTILLNMCSHTGLLGVAQSYFETMRSSYGIILIKEHLTCMVDLFGRAGLLDEAIAIINNMPFLACRMVWQILLTASRNRGFAKLGRLAFEHAAQLDVKDSAAYVCIGNLYAAVELEDCYAAA